MAGARAHIGRRRHSLSLWPYKIGGRHTAPSNEDFDTWLRSQNAAWGIRDLDDVTDLAKRHNFTLVETVQMPANNLSVIFRRESVA